MITLPWHRKAPSAGRWPLYMPLLSFGSEAWTLRDSFSGLAIFGQTGSGKTSASGRTVALRMLKAGYGGLVCCAKRTEADLWRRYLKETGRVPDVRPLHSASKFHFKFIPTYS